MNAKKCDRCKGFFRTEDATDGNDEMLHLDKLEFWKRAMIVTTNYKGLDLCPMCTKRFREFMKNEPMLSEVTTSKEVRTNGN